MSEIEKKWYVLRAISGKDERVTICIRDVGFHDSPVK